MRTSSMLTPSFLLLFAFLINLPLLAFSRGQPVVDTNGSPLFSDGEYFMVPATRGSGGGLRIGPTGSSKCPVTVIQDDFYVNHGMPAKFTVVGQRPGLIFPGAPLQIEYTQRPNCASSSIWWLYGDNNLPGKIFAGIGSARDNPDITSIAGDGNFTIRTSGCGYKLGFCQGNNCVDLGRNDDHEGGSRLVLSPKPFEFSFVNVNNVADNSKFHAPNVVKASNLDGIVIRSVA